MRSIFIVFYFCLFSTLKCQDYAAQFDKFFESNNLQEQANVLNEWGKYAPDDAEYIIRYFNYYYHIAKTTGINISEQKPNGESLSLENKENGNKAYLGENTNFDLTNLQQGLDKISQGIIIYPDRLDMRFGKIYVLGQIQDWTKFTKEIISAIEQSAKNKNQWLWSNHLPKEDGRNFFLSVIQSYQNQLYEVGDDALLSNMREIAETILLNYPKNVESLSTLSVTYLLVGDYDKAISYLTKAEQIDPKDYIVLSNIAQAYKLKGDKANALKYFEKILKFGDEETKNLAKQQIEELNK